MHSEPHPNDELLAALAADEPEAVDDGMLRDHVAACARCAGLVGELATLRAALTELPDLRPSRPLQLVPALPASAGHGSRRWLRGLFAPLLVAGSGLVLVGALGLVNNGSGAVPTGATVDFGNLGAGAPEAASVSPEPAPRSVASPVPATDAGDEITAPRAASGAPRASEPPTAPSTSDERPAISLPSPAVLILIAGLALLGAALVLRFAIAPRAG